MAIFACVFCGSMSCLIMLANRNFFEPMFSFTLLFFFVMTTNISGFYSIYKASDTTFLFMTLGIFFFNIGSMIQRKCGFAVRHNKRDFQLNKKVYWIMVLVCNIILFLNILDIIIFLLSGNSIGDVYITVAKAARGELNILSQPAIVVVLEQYVAYPLLYLLVPTSLAVFFREYKIRYLMVAILLTALRVIIDARRTYLVCFIMMLIVCFFFHKNDAKYSKNHHSIRIKQWRKRIIVLGAGVSLFFVYITFQRYKAVGRSDDAVLLRTLVYYYGGTVKYLEHSIKSFDGQMTYGFSTLRGFFAPIFSVTSKLGIGAPKAFLRATSILNGMAGNIISISPTKTFNSFATVFYQFYCDAGGLGLIFYSFIYGMYSENLFLRYESNKNVRNESKYLFWYCTILMMSFVNIGTVLPLAAWPLIIERFLFFCKEKKFGGNI